MCWCKDTGKGPAGPASEQGALKSSAEGLSRPDTISNLDMQAVLFIFF